MPKLNGIDGRMVLQDLYETEFGVYNHLSGDKSRPLASVALHPSEDINDGSILEEVIRTYIAKGIRDIYGLSLVEFLELPYDVMEMMNSIADEEQQKKTKAIANISKDFKT